MMKVIMKLLFFCKGPYFFRQYAFCIPKKELVLRANNSNVIFN